MKKKRRILLIITFLCILAIVVAYCTEVKPKAPQQYIEEEYPQDVKLV
jgi:hypothetical protein